MPKALKDKKISKEDEVIKDIPIKEIDPLDPIEVEPILAEETPEEIEVGDDELEDGEEMESLGGNWDE